MITGGRVTKVFGEKLKEDAVQQLSVNIDITDLSFEGGLAKIAYVYAVKYEPGLAKIEVSGELFFDEKASKDLKGSEEEWKKNKTVPQGITEEVLSSVTYSGSAVGTLIAFSLNVGAPINVPKAKLAPLGDSKQEGKAG
ncbi:MAG: hypothetical protein ACE5DI_02190 [Candidatus Micrarchaeia archaeon]